MSTKGKMESVIQQLLQQQLRFMELFSVRLSTPQQTSQETKLCAPGDTESVRRSIRKFHCDTDVKSTFPRQFARYKHHFFTVDLKELVDDWIVWLGSVEHD